MELDPISEDEVTAVYKTLKQSNAVDSDGLSKRVIDTLFDALLKPITRLFNLSFEKGVFPTDMKISKVTPVFKAGDKTQPTNYRPIAILPILSKLLEKIFCSRLVDHLDESNIITPAQFGFQKKKSTVHAAIHYYESVATALKDKCHVLSISLDMTKAFDSISHDILLTKLDCYGIRGVAYSWIKSYLCNRLQNVSIDTTTASANFPITSGVPQGSNLGPVLFLVYINDLVNSTDKFNFILFADDTTILFPFHPRTVSIPELNNELSLVSDWLKCNKLLLNVKKTQSIIYRPSNCIAPELDIAIDNQKLVFVDQINFLGITFDNQLNFKAHVARVRLKVSRTLGFLNKSKNLLSLKLRRQLYFALIYPHLIYGIELWGATTKTILQPLHILQNRAIRYISGLKSRSSTLSHYKKLFIPKFEDLHRIHSLSLAYKAFNNELPANIQRLFTHSQTLRRTRQAGMNMAVVIRSTKVQNLRPSVNCPYLWNSLSPDLKQLPSINAFKNRLKQITLSGY